MGTVAVLRNDLSRSSYGQLNLAGTIVDGNPDKVSDITDVWTFARDVTSRDPNWKLVGTGSAH